MLFISNIDKQTHDIVCYIVKKAGGTVSELEKNHVSTEPQHRVEAKDKQEQWNELNLSDSYNEAQIKSINKRWKVIEKSYLNAEKMNS